MRPIRAAFLAAVTVLVVASAAQARSTIVYTCGNNLCRLDPKTHASRQLTHDGKGGKGPVYRQPSLSRDGKRLAFVFANDLYLSRADGTRRTKLDDDVAIPYLAPGGDTVAYAASRFSLIAPAIYFPCCSPAIYGQVPYLFRIKANGKGKDTVARSIVTSGWLGNRLMRDEQPDGDAPPDLICVLETNSSFECDHPVAEDPARDISEPSASRDGRFVAAVAEPHSDDPDVARKFEGVIALFDAASGALLRDLTTGPHDSEPAFSPDGKQVAFARGKNLYVVPVNGGKARKLHRGVQPTWGGR
jgi:Tol biopolymer transport system component